MIVSIADTHSAIWYLFNDLRLSQTARKAFEKAIANGDHVAVSAISLAEIVYLSEKNRIPATTLEQTVEVLRDPVTVLKEVPVDSAVVKLMRNISRQEIPDLPDRIIAATSLRYDVPVISRDGKIRAANLRTIW